MTARTLPAALLVAVVGTALAQPPKPEPAPQPKAKLDAKPAPDVAAKLATRVTIEPLDETFKNAVKLFADKYELALVIDPRTGSDGIGAGAVAVKGACDSPADDRPVKLPKLVNVRLDTALRLVTEQVGAKFLVYPDHVKIVPAAFAEYESGSLAAPGPDSTEQPLVSPEDLVRTRPLIRRALVNASFKNKPLTEVIDEIAEATGATLAVSPLVPANVRQAPVTVRFANTPVDAAVRTLCEMTECAAIEEANVLLVTTRERAAARAKEEAQKLKDKQSPILGGCLGVGFGAAGTAGPLPDLATEIAHLKEQNQKLQKELDAIKKLLQK